MLILTRLRQVRCLFRLNHDWNRPEITATSITQRCRRCDKIVTRDWAAHNRGKP